MSSDCNVKDLHAHKSYYASAILHVQYMYNKGWQGTEPGTPCDDWKFTNVAYNSEYQLYYIKVKHGKLTLCGIKMYVHV